MAIRDISSSLPNEKDAFYLLTIDNHEQWGFSYL
jgi:hypothetical protein